MRIVEAEVREGKGPALESVYLDFVIPTLAELYQWKMALDSQPESTVLMTSRDIDISKFTLVAGKRFN